MAVKQNNTEGSTPVSSMTQAKKQNSNDNNTSCDENLKEILNIIKFYSKSHFIENTCKIYYKLIQHLAKISLREPQQISCFREEIYKIQDFLRKLCIGHNTDIYINSLKIVYDLIIKEENVSGAVAIVLELFPENSIDNFVSLILNERNQNDNNIRKLVKVLCKWVKESALFCPNMNNWIITIINQLKESNKIDLLYDIALDNIECLLNSLQVPALMLTLAPVIYHMLSATNKDPKIFHKIISKAPNVVRKLKIDNQKYEDTRNVLPALIQLFSKLMVQFPNHDELYQPLQKAISDYEQTYNYQLNSQKYKLWSPSTYNFVIGKNVKVGLVNLGNTCYMNSVLQALAITKEFSRGILLSNVKTPLFTKIQKLFAQILYSNRRELTPISVLNATKPPGFINGHQQDSSEFLNYLLDLLNEQEIEHYKLNQIEINNDIHTNIFDDDNDDDIFTSEGAISLNFDEKIIPNYQLTNINQYPTIISRSFAGKLTTTYKCLKCLSESKNTDNFRDLQLSFPTFKNDCKKLLSVKDLLDYYNAPEKLHGDNQYFCDNCKHLNDAERYINIINAPKNLILTLKHFKYDQIVHTRAKLMHKVFHEEKLILKVYEPDIIDDFTLVHYDLYAAVIHSGYSMDSGHYYTYATDNFDTWYKFNDNNVTICSIKELHNLHPPNTPYILFYQMKSNSGENLGTSNNFLNINTIDLPKIDELSINLRDFINKDNSLFKQELNRTIKINSINNDLLCNKNDNDDNEPPNN